MDIRATLIRDARRVAAMLQVVVLLLATGFGAPSAAEEAYVFALQGDGAATAVIDRAASKAWITDGGRNGSSGIREARIGGQDVLDYLASQGITDLAITCSHPHSDHMGGLEELVRDPRIRKFTSIYFVDNGDKQTSSLYQQYTTKWAGSGQGPQVAYANATNKEVFGQTKFARANVRVRNFVYDASRVGGTDHDRSIIMQYTLPGEPPPQTVVDFDDASTRLVEEWASRSDAYASILIHPHHGSSNNSIDAILSAKGKIGLKDVVIPVNRNNRYLHPSPATLLKLLEQLGPNHVFVTDSDLGENVVINGRSIWDSKSEELHLAKLRDFVVAQQERYEARIRQAFQENHLEAGKIAAAWTSSRSSGKRQDAFPSSSRDRRIWQWMDGVRAYKRALDIIDHPKRSSLLTMVSGYKLWPFSDDDLLPPERGPIEPTGGPPRSPSGGTEAFFKKEVEASAGGAAQSRPDRFKMEIARARPLFGGIVLGNQVKGPSIAGELTFAREGGADENAVTRPIIRLRTLTGTFDFVGLTSSELWVAYNLVSPTANLTSRYPGKTIDSPALVGLDCDKNNSCNVALHPALAGTLLGWDAIYADNVMVAAHEIATKKTAGKLPGAFSDIKWGDFNYHALQWFDGPSSVALRGTSINVSSASGGSCLLQIRISTFDKKGYIAASSDVVKSAINARIGPRMVDDMIGIVRKEIGSGARIDPEFEARMAVAQLIASQNPSGKAWYAALVAKIEANEKSYWKTSPWPTAQIQRPCLEYPPLAAMNRIAKLVAILRWRQNNNGGQLPALPDWVQPVSLDTGDKVQLVGDPYFPLMKN